MVTNGIAKALHSAAARKLYKEVIFYEELTSVYVFSNSFWES